MWPALARAKSPERDNRMQQAVVKPSWPGAINALLRPERMSLGSCEVSRRRTPRIMATRMAAVRPLPETSPTIAVSEPPGVDETKKKSPPGRPPGACYTQYLSLDRTNSAREPCSMSGPQAGKLNE